ncbi:PD-(D/E)XK motif protein [Micromonospora sp. NPDC048986]|uniref:PD-(D/E)XK motif protein n=1 Tax=Micromonospora sp. NPDC048986 TaxID=3155644 RepID=UPI0033E9E7AE
MTAPTVDEIARLFAQMELAPPDQPGVLRRRLRADLRHLDIHVEVALPERTRALVVTAADAVDDQQLLNTAGLRCSTQGGTVRVQAEPNVEAELFCTLVADLVHHAGTAAVQPTAALVHRIRCWQKMLAAGLNTGLSAQAQLGLFGELVALREIALPAWGPAALQAWVGPTGAPQDFRYGRAALEVKCVSYRDPEHCRISNERQLDSADIDLLCLVHQSVRSGFDGGVTLPEIIDSVRADPALAGYRLLLEERLMHAGWLDVHRHQYERERYGLTARRCYRVVPGFPRLTSRDVPTGVRSVSYSVELDQCAPFLLTERDLAQLLRQHTPEEVP